MNTAILDKPTFDNSQRVRDKHYVEAPAHDLFTSHRDSCEYCFRRLRMMELPKLQVFIRHPDKDGFEMREVLDKYDPRFNK